MESAPRLNNVIFSPVISSYRGTNKNSTELWRRIGGDVERFERRRFFLRIPKDCRPNLHLNGFRFSLGNPFVRWLFDLSSILIYPCFIQSEETISKDLGTLLEQLETFLTTHHTISFFGEFSEIAALTLRIAFSCTNFGAKYYVLVLHFSVIHDHTMNLINDFWCGDLNKLPKRSHI